MLLPNLVYADVTLSDASNPTEISDEYFVKLFQTAQVFSMLCICRSLDG